MSGLFLGVRALHVLLGAIWLGTAVMASFFVLPAIQEAGPEGGKVMGGLVRRGLVAFIPSIAGLTVLSGLWLYWRFTAGFDPIIRASMGGRVFSTGGGLGLIAAIIGGSVVARNMKKAIKLMTEASDTTDAAARASLMQQAGKARATAGKGGRIVAILLMVTIVLMAIGHYV